MKLISSCHGAAPTAATGAPRPCGRPRVTAAAYPGHAGIPSFATGLGFATRPSTVPAPAITWAMNRLEVTKVDVHDRWPLHSPS